MGVDGVWTGRSTPPLLLLPRCPETAASPFSNPWTDQTAGVTNPWMSNRTPCRVAVDLDCAGGPCSTPPDSWRLGVFAMVTHSSAAQWELHRGS